MIRCWCGESDSLDSRVWSGDREDGKRQWNAEIGMKCKNFKNEQDNLLEYNIFAAFAELGRFLVERVQPGENKELLLEL